MDADTYQRHVMMSASYSGRNTTEGLVYVSNELTHKSRAVQDRVAGAVYEEGNISVDATAQIVDLLGDVLWECAMIADELGLGLDFVMQRNAIKLQSRRPQSVLVGSVYR